MKSVVVSPLNEHTIGIPMVKGVNTKLSYDMHEEHCPTVLVSSYKEPICVVKPRWWDGGQVASTLTTRSLHQYMPDKDNFGAVLHPRCKVISVDQGGGKRLQPVAETIRANASTNICGGVIFSQETNYKRIPQISYKVLEGQFGATIRNNNNWWHEVAGTITTSNGDNLHSIVKIRTKGKQ